MISVQNKRVFLRADLNVPITNNTIIQDHRLRAILPTIDLLLKQHATIVLATHLGRPTAREEAFSTKILYNWFKDKGYDIVHEMDLLKAKEIKGHDIILLENLRFFKGEKETNDTFAKLLAQLADVYINDAFGMIHRHDTSVTLLAHQFDKTQKSFGPLVEQEIQALTKLKQSPRPFIVILGGNKSDTKKRLFKQLAENNVADTILIGGKLAQDIIPTQYEGTNVILPVDDIKGFDIGPETIKLFCAEIEKAKTIFFNGTMGKCEKKEYEHGTRQVLHAITKTDAYTVIGGGDAVAAVHAYGVADKMDFLSTGGGATLAFLASEDTQNLPAIAAVNYPPLKWEACRKSQVD